MRCVGRPLGWVWAVTAAGTALVIGLAYSGRFDLRHNRSATGAPTKVDSCAFISFHADPAAISAALPKIPTPIRPPAPKKLPVPERCTTLYVDRIGWSSGCDRRGRG